jgi:transportin-1
LLGDLAKACYAHLQPTIHQFIPILAANLDPEHVSVCNKYFSAIIFANEFNIYCNFSSIWALGEISLKLGEGMRQYIHGLFTLLQCQTLVMIFGLVILPQLIQVMNREKGPKTLLENTGEI